jgi:DNA-binding response OmpR family regulator
MQNANKIVSGKNLVNIIWGSDMFVPGSPFENCIVNLQQKLGSRFIEIVSKGHYRFNAARTDFK